MDQKTAKKLFQEGAVFVFLNVPEGTEFGIDMKSWNTGEKFRGVKMIPPGLHYIFYNAVGNTGDVAPRSGFFHNFRKGELVVKKWDKQAEDISNEEVSEEEIVRLKDNLQALDNFLGPYPYDVLGKWQNLTTNITEELVQNLIPSSGIVRSALELEPCSDADRPRGNVSEPSCSKRKKPKLFKDDGDNDLLPQLKPKKGTELRLSKFPEKLYPDGSTASAITYHSLDSTFVLDQMVKCYDNPTDIIGEMEFCYVVFLVGHSLEAFDQWKKLVSLLCNCETAIKKYRKLYDLLITMLGYQIKEIPEEFLADIVSNNNFLYVKLRNLFRNIQESNVDGQLKTKAERFQRLLTATYMWDFDNLDLEEGEDAPIVVETE